MAKPRNLEKLARAAELKLLGSSQKEIAKALGVSDRTLRNWEGWEEWDDALTQARKGFAGRLAAKTRKVLMDSLDDPAQAAQTARFLAPKLLPELQTSEGKPQREYVWWDMGNHIAEFY